MSWRLVETLAWEDPLALAESRAKSDMALLHSSMRDAFTGASSYLLLDPLETIEGNDWAELPPLPSDGEPLPLWVGYLGYGMRDAPERGDASPITLPDFRLVKYATLYHFDHNARVVRLYRSESSGGESSSVAPPLGGSQNRPSRFWWGVRFRRFLQRLNFAHSNHTPHQIPRGIWLPPKGGAAEPASRLSSNLTRAEYERIVAETIEQIHAGNFYQANITRKFMGEFSLSPRARPGVSRNMSEQTSGDPGLRRDDGPTINSFHLFQALCDISPAPYSAYIRHGDTAIISSSPECFLNIDASGTIITRPIKGSARRSENESDDKKIREMLATSTKNHAENLMIVDLMRNDLSRVSEPKTVEVVEQSALYSYRTIHHLISTIRAQKRANVSAYDAVRACFPPGSMTGAPKIAAVKWCTAREKLERGVYSGAIGWFGAGDTCHLSVVIRTLIIKGNRFEFQVGGGIVADSIPADEWRETLAKARGILLALGLHEEIIAAI